MSSVFSYSGPAQLVYPNEKTVEVECDLDEFEDMPGGLKDWSGSGSAARPFSSGEARIRLPNGDEADVLVTNVNVSGSANGGVRVELTLQGSGRPPGAES